MKIPIYKILPTSLFILISILFCIGQDLPSKNSKLHQLFDDIISYEKSLSKFGELYKGEHPLELGYHNSKDYENQLSKYELFLENIVAIDTSQLSPDDRISYETMQLKLFGQIGQLKFKNYLIPLNAEGGFYNTLSRAINRLPFNTTKDYEAYAKWLPSYAEYLNGNINLLREGMSEGIVAPKVIIDNTIKLLMPWISKDADEHPFTSMLKECPPGISAQDWTQIKIEILDIMQKAIWPGYDRLLDFLQNEYYLKAYDAPGISNIPNGRSYYENRVAYYTTLDISPGEVYNKGLAEVARIRSRLEAIIVEVNFSGSFSEFLDFLRTDEQFFAKTPQELLSYASWLSKKAEGQLPRFFSHLYELPFTVEPVPSDIAPTYTSGRYVRGSRSQDRAGIYWVNTYNLPARTLYNLPALTLHEAVPGHHLQNMIASELEGIPEFRNRFSISAYGEGWGLYSEYLGEEMGMYTTPYERFGRYTYEMWRACRLVIDVGLHYKGWSRDEAVEYLASNTALSMHEVNTEIDRYIGWPGQAVSYKIGEIIIKNLRQKAEDTLGDDFDIKEFHFHVLKNGSVPLPTLIREIEQWIDDSIKQE